MNFRVAAHRRRGLTPRRGALKADDLQVKGVQLDGPGGAPTSGTSHPPTRRAAETHDSTTVAPSDAWPAAAREVSRCDTAASHAGGTDSRLAGPGASGRYPADAGVRSDRELAAGHIPAPICPLPRGLRRFKANGVSWWSDSGLKPSVVPPAALAPASGPEEEPARGGRRLSL
jgi:hypothetical protein